jgi:signal transduction histidine kinase
VGPIRELLAGKAQIPLLGDDPRNPKGEKIFTATRIPEHGKLEGYLYVILGGEAYDSVVQKLKGSYILQMSGWMIGAGLLFALITGLILFALLTRRLKRLSKAVSEYNVAEPLKLTHLPVTGAHLMDDEIDRLASTFKKMAEKIQDQMNELRESDNLRRELIANVSHDLRTPLSTLQGYVETLLLKQNQLSGEEKRTYLETAVKHCKRLGNLVSELFELAKLESGQIRLQCEPFNLSELVQDVVLKFQLKAKEKGVQLMPSTQTDISFVKGDIGLIERVFENLIENAIHYTPEDGSVEVRLLPDTEGIFVQIADSGSGIPEEELSHIFQRFYRLGKSRERDSGHSGLGLAIAKKILELHRSVISVQSHLNSGTTFSFHLDTYSPLEQPSPV